MSNMFLRNSTLLQCFMCFLLLLPAIVYAFPTTELSHRYERDASETVVFSEGEELDLVLQSGNNLLFETCCNKDGGCNEGSFVFCFQTTHVTQGHDGLAGCYAGTCSYQVSFHPNGRRVFFMGWFNTTDSCFNGKIDDEKIYAISVTGLPLHNVKGCPLDIVQPGNRLRLHVKEIPDGVTVKTLNAYKYIEPTTLPPTTTPPPTEEPKEAKKEPSAAGATTPETGMSDALKFSLIGVGIFVFVLIVGGIGFAIYWFCFKKKKSSKPVPPLTVAKTADATPVTKEAPIVDHKTFKPKPKTTTENETQDVERSKHVASKVHSKNVAPSNVISSSAAAAEIPPSPPMASKDFTASREPNNNSEFSKTDVSKLKTDDQSLFDDESGRDGQSLSNKSHGQTSFSKEVAAAIDKKKMKKKAMK